jgi:serine phosphatase RsbU (regulator of sigma subunit)
VAKLIGSLRTKALLIFVLVILMTLAFYVQLATSLFRSDKNDFVQEAALTRASSLAYLIKSQIEMGYNLENQLYSMHQTNPELLNDFISKDLFTLGYFIINKNIIKKESETYHNEYVEETQILFSKKYLHRRLKNSLKLSYKQFETIPARLLLNTNLLQDRDSAVFSGTQLFEVPCLVLVTFHREKNEYSAMVIDLELLAGQFESDGLFKNSLWTGQGDNIIKGGIFADKDFLSKAFSSHEITGVHNYEKNSEPILLAHSKIKSEGLIILSEMQTTRAYRMDKILMRKSLLYSVIAFCLASIAALIVVSAPIARLKLLLFNLEEWINTGVYNSQEANGLDEVSVAVRGVNSVLAKFEQKIDSEMKNRIDKLKLEENREFNSTLTQQIFPLASCAYDGCEVSSFFRPSIRYNSAWWYHTEQAGQQLFFICQGTKAGALASHEMAKLFGMISTIDMTQYTSPSKILTHINSMLKNKTSIKAFCGIYRPAQKEFLFTNAGQMSPVLFSETNPNELAGLCPVEGIPLGDENNPNYKDKKVSLSKGNHLFFYTEGTILAQDAKKVALGQRGLLSLLVTSHKKSPHLQEQTMYLGQQISAKLGRPGPDYDILCFNIKIL